MLIELMWLKLKSQQILHNDLCLHHRQYHAQSQSSMTLLFTKLKFDLTSQRSIFIITQEPIIKLSFIVLQLFSIKPQPPFTLTIFLQLLLLLILKQLISQLIPFQQPTKLQPLMLRQLLLPHL